MTTIPTFRILVVDENPAVRLFVDLAVGSEFVRVVGAADGYAALNSVERARPDLVLAAMGMTGLGGHDLAARLSRRKLPVVLMTSRLGRKGAEAGAAVSVLAKPLQLQQLHELVWRMTSGQLKVAALPALREEPAVQAPREVDAVDAWLSHADEALGVVPNRWRRLAAEGQDLHPFAHDVAAFRAGRMAARRA